MVTVKALICEEWDPVTWGGDEWEDPIRVENFERMLKGLSYLRKKSLHS